MEEELIMDNIRYTINSGSSNQFMEEINIKIRHETVINGTSEFIRKHSKMDIDISLNMPFSPSNYTFTIDSSMEYTLFIVEILKDGKNIVLGRRYSHFYDLHKHMIAEYGKKQVPEFPKKRWFGNLDPNFIELRKKELEIYLHNVLTDPLLQKSDQIIEFIKIPLKF
eukprot:TRINITY_DN11333_c0_g1_i1.p1 TRINITY_DN11333_c0_g1~~TRINITY_DN11333_c0_g1_i1.p1  ORF type:complete len:176 (-),score=26.14 TRINITY_DN11333_c0_g1_i1:74-574(-)